MTNLWLSNNPYECNCDMLWMKDWLVDTGNVMDKENVTCSGNGIKGEYNDIICFSIILHQQV